MLRVGEWTVEMRVELPEGEMVALREAAVEVAVEAVVETTVETTVTAAEEEAGAGVLEATELLSAVCSA
jgi:hypothetical protein